MLVREPPDNIKAKEFVYKLTEIGIFDNSEIFSGEMEVNLFIVAEISGDYHHDNQKPQGKGAFIG